MIEEEAEIPEYLLTNENFEFRSQAEIKADEIRKKEKDKQKKKEKKQRKKERDEEQIKEEEKEESYLVPGDEGDYDSNKSFMERIYLAVFKFNEKCKFDPKKREIFKNYLCSGGIDIKIKPFSKGDDKEADKELKVGDDSGKVDAQVDFLFSIYQFILRDFILDPTYVDLSSYELVSKVITKFLNYLLASKTCPEYDEDIKESLLFLIKVENQLPLTKNVSLLLLDTFNSSCSLLFGGHYGWMRDSSFCKEEDIKKVVGLSRDDAKALVKQELERDDLKVVTKRKTRMEIFKIQQKEDKTYLLLKEQKLEDYAKLEEDTGIDPLNWKYLPEFYVRVDSNLAPYLISNMVIQATFYKLCNDSWFFDTVIRVIPPFVKQDMPV